MSGLIRLAVVGQFSRGKSTLMTVRTPEWVVPIELPRRLPRKASGSDQQITRYLAEGLAAAITSYGERARTRFRESARDWAARLGDEASRRLEEAAEWFCPLHTWQYASVGSPLGISAGYAKLATAVADALESVSRRDEAPENLARAVNALAPGPAGCPLCQALAACERDAIAEAASRVPDNPLCVRHLGLALAAPRRRPPGP